MTPTSPATFGQRIPGTPRPRRFYLVAGFVLLFSLLWLLPSPPKTAGASLRAVLLIARQPPDVRARARQDAKEDFWFPRHVVALVRSRLVLIIALRQPSVACLASVKKQPDPVEWLEQNIRTRFSEETGRLEITLAAGSVAERVELVNSVAQALLTEFVDRKRNALLRRLDLLTKLFRKNERILREKREPLKTLAKALGAGANKDGVRLGLDLRWPQEEIQRFEMIAREFARQRQIVAIEADAEPRVTLLQKAKVPNK